MSLQPPQTSIGPEQPARMAKAALPQGTLCLHRSAQLGTSLPAHDLTELFP